MLASMEDRCQTDRVTKPTRAGLRRCRWRQPTDEESPTRGLPRRMLCHYGCQSLLTLFTFKLCCLVHAIHYGRSRAYLTETVQSVGASRSVAGHAHLLPRRLTTLYHGYAHSVPDRQFVRAVSEALRYLAQPGELAATSARTGVGAAHARPSVVAAVPGGSSSPVGVVVVHRRRSARLHIVSTRRHHGCGG